MTSGPHSDRHSVAIVPASAVTADMARAVARAASTIAAIGPTLVAPMSVDTRASSSGITNVVAATKSRRQVVTTETW